MASKLDGSDDGAQRQKPTARNHGIDFKDAEQRNRYKSLVSRPISACRYPDSNALITVDIRDNVVRLLNTLGWVELLRPMRGFENFTYEFSSSLAFTKDRSKSDNPNHKDISENFKMSLEIFCLKMGFANAGFIHDFWDQSLRPSDYDHVAFWKSIRSKKKNQKE